MVLLSLIGDLIPWVCCSLVSSCAPCFGLDLVQFRSVRTGMLTWTLCGNIPAGAREILTKYDEIWEMCPVWCAYPLLGSCVTQFLSSSIAPVSASAKVDLRGLKARRPELHKTEQDNAVYGCLWYHHHPSSVPLQAVRGICKKIWFKGHPKIQRLLSLSVLVCFLVSERFGSLDAVEPRFWNSSDWGCRLMGGNRGNISTAKLAQHDQLVPVASFTRPSTWHDLARAGNTKWLRWEVLEANVASKSTLCGLSLSQRRQLEFRFPFMFQNGFFSFLSSISQLSKAK